MTTLDLKTQPIRLALHRADDAATWWFHRTIEHTLYRADLAWYYIAQAVFLAQVVWINRVEPALTRPAVARRIIITVLLLVSLAAATLALN